MYRTRLLAIPLTGFFGGMGGCAMIGQSMFNRQIQAAPHGCGGSLAAVSLLLYLVGAPLIEQIRWQRWSV